MLLAARAMRAWVAPTMVSVPGSREAFDEEGRAHDPSAPKLRQSQFMLVPHNFYALWTSDEIIDDRAKQRDEEDDKYPDQFVVPFR